LLGKNGGSWRFLVPLAEKRDGLVATMGIVERSNAAAASGASGGGGGGGGGLIVEEQQEKLRRFVDEWRGQVSETVQTMD
jgi:hypothetical protein